MDTSLTVFRALFINQFKAYVALKYDYDLCDDERLNRNGCSSSFDGWSHLYVVRVRIGPRSFE